MRNFLKNVMPCINNLFRGVLSMLALLAGLQGCTTEVGKLNDLDEDGDGHGQGYGDDCNDSDPSIYPDAPELCDGKDNDCDGTADEIPLSEGEGTVYYADNDGDNFGDPDDTITACSQPAGYITDSTDCNDSDNDDYPGATEVCDGADNDCNGEVDDNAADAGFWYTDADGDSYGDPSTATALCGAEPGYVADATDCDDINAAINPSATEICDEQDNNCNSVIDTDATDAPTWYLDADGDLYGGTTTTAACDQPSGYVTNNQDCDDSNAAVNPSSIEVCNNIDDDCDGDTDEYPIDGITWYYDGDGDNYGNLLVTDLSCDQPAGYVSDSTDCNDGNPGANPGATEICDSVDNDCDGTSDEGDAADATNWYADTDSDGYGDPAYLARACTEPVAGFQYVTDSSDCDDSNAAINPGATEVCDEVDADEDCSGTADVFPAEGMESWFEDSDGDGSSDGDISKLDLTCDPLPGYVQDVTDCDDSNAAINTNADELCNGADDDCDGTVDEADALDVTVWYADTDGDLYGDVGNTALSCDQPDGYLADSSDCDDTDVSINPGADEFCNGLDDDCNGLDDDGAVDPDTMYEDNDGDGYGNGASIQSCDLLTGYVYDLGDCDDSDVLTYPGAPEIWYDGINQNCDSLSDYDADYDGTDLWSDGRGSDCNDYNPQINTAATEACNGLDDDCDGNIDEDWAVGAECTYDDNDGDGYGASNEDCDDLNVSVNPGAIELCNDDVDNDCSGIADNLDGLEVCY